MREEVEHFLWPVVVFAVSDWEPFCLLRRVAVGRGNNTKEGKNRDHGFSALQNNLVRCILSPPPFWVEVGWVKSGQKNWAYPTSH